MNIQDSRQEKIDNLWKWFENHETKIIESIDKELATEQAYYKNQLDNFILDFGLFSWQIGENGSGKWYLTISPNGNKDLLFISKEIIENAPQLDSWAFNYCKPAQEWNRKLTLYDSFMNLQDIDTSRWFYISKKQDEGVFDLTIEAGQIAVVDLETAKKAAEMLVINELGEEFKIWNLNSIEVVEKIEGVKISIADLRSNFV